MKTLAGLILCAVAGGALAQHPDDLLDHRVCGAVLRMPDGSIARSTAVIAAFKRVHPCPVSGATSGPCAGWAIDHVIPLACGGCDSVTNMQWLPLSLKSCAGGCKDRWERKIYCTSFTTVGPAP